MRDDDWLVKLLLTGFLKGLAVGLALLALLVLFASFPEAMALLGLGAFVWSWRQSRREGRRQRAPWVP